MHERPEGRRIAGRYRLGRLLGRGGMADVFDAVDERLERPVAVKLLRPEVDRDPAMRARFEREARAAARLTHRNVVAVYDSGEDHGHAYLVMERLPGETLADRMRAGPLPPTVVAGVAADVLRALDAAHERGLVHRDIKPANILIDADGSAKVADFGIAKAYREAAEADAPVGPDPTRTGVIVGTVAYLAPEQLRGDAASPRSDLYALGVVCFEALTGRKPFPAENALVAAHAAVTGRAPDLLDLRPEVPPHLADVVRRAMSAEPAERPATAAAMLAELRAAEPPGTQALAAPTLLDAAPETRVLADGPLDGAASPGGRLDGTTVRRSRRSGWVVAAVLAAALLAALGAVLLDGGGRRAATASTSTPASSSTTASGVDAELRSAAAAFRQDGGPGREALATLLDAVASAPAAQQPARATAAIRDVLALERSGSITSADAQQAIADLIAANGSLPTTTTTPTTATTAPPATAPPATPAASPPPGPATHPGHGKGGHGHG